MNNSKQNKSHLAIVQSARTLFWKFGVRKVTVEEICREANVSKMTFYRFFSNKIGLAELVLEEILNDGMGQFKNIMNKQIPFADKMKEMIFHKREGSANISKEFIHDIYQAEDLTLRVRMEDHRKHILDETMESFRMAQQNGWIRSDIKIEFIMFMMGKLSEMAIDETLLHIYKNPQDAIMEATNFFFYGIMSDQKPTK